MCIHESMRYTHCNSTPPLSVIGDIIYQLCCPLAPFFLSCFAMVVPIPGIYLSLTHWLKVSLTH